MTLQGGSVRALFVGLFGIAALCAPGVRTHGAEPSPAADSAFSLRTQQLATELTIPGVAYAVIHNGKVLGKAAFHDANAAPFAVDTPRRIASVTKTFTAVLLMRAVESGRLALDDSASKWHTDLRDRPEITVRHLAAHVSEGVPGTEFVYGSSRYARLGEILRAAYGAKSFEEVVRREIIEPAGMRWHDSPELGAHAALVSTVSDLAQFAVALQEQRLISRRAFGIMSTPFATAEGVKLPVGVGVFSQQIGGERVVWSFGQDDPDYGSALFLMLPKRKLTLVMLANTDELSNPFRLLMGNLRTSPFATAFLDYYAPDLAKAIDARDRLVTDILIGVAREDVDSVGKKLQLLASTRPDPRADDFALHFVAAMLPSQLPREFTAALDARVAGAHSRNRWALLMSGGLNTGLGNTALAVARYEALLALPNQEQDFLAKLFRAWSCAGLANALKSQDPARALKYVEEGLATGVTGPTREGLVALKSQLSTAAPPSAP
jgi:CubicO group peptidase (beta-lactamase class C family)